MTFPALVARAADSVESAQRRADAATDAAEAAQRAAKRGASRHRRASQAAPDDVELRALADEAGDVVSDAGRELVKVRAAGDELVASARRELTMWRFEAALEDWVSRFTDTSAENLPAARWFDRTLYTLADGDDYLAAALHLHRDGVTAPEGWRLPSGAPFVPHDYRPGSDQG